MCHSKMKTMSMKLNIKGVVLLLASVTIWAGCSDDFLKEKQNYGSTTEELYNNYEGAKNRVNFLYSRYLPITASGATFNDTWFSTGNPDLYSQSTEEYGGLSEFVNSSTVLDYQNVTDFFHGEKKVTAPWGVSVIAMT